MFYNNLILHSKIWNWVSAGYKQNRLPHAMLFHGNPGCGKEGHAIELAALVNCRFPGTNGACGSCPDCIKLRSFQHPNIHTVIPFPKRNAISKNDPPEKSLKPKDLELLILLNQQKGNDPYSQIELPDANTILINSIRYIKKELYNSSIESGWQVVLIFQAEKLCIPSPESANALLKILEEPPDKTLFILVTDHISQLLDTIVSRCQQTYFPPFDFETIKKNLVETKSHTELKLIYHLTDGNIHRIRENVLSSKNLLEEAEFMTNLLSNSSSEFRDQFTNDLGRLKRKGKSHWEYKMKFLLVIIRDLLLLSEDQNSSQLVLPDMTSQYEKLLSRFRNADWHRCLEIVENTIYNINRNGYLPLVIHTMFIEINRILNGEKTNFSPLPA